MTEGIQLQNIALTEGEITPRLLNETEEALFAEFRLGEEAIAFLNSELGLLIRGFALQEMALAKEKLMTVDPTDQKAIIKLQNKAARADEFLGFIQEAINSGEQAGNALIENQE